MLHRPQCSSHLSAEHCPHFPAVRVRGGFAVFPTRAQLLAQPQPGDTQQAEPWAQSKMQLRGSGGMHWKWRLQEKVNPRRRQLGMPCSCPVMLTACPNQCLCREQRGLEVRTAREAYRALPGRATPRWPFGFQPFHCCHCQPKLGFHLYLRVHGACCTQQPHPHRKARRSPP